MEVTRLQQVFADASGGKAELTKEEFQKALEMLEVIDGEEGVPEGVASVSFVYPSLAFQFSPETSSSLHSPSPFFACRSTGSRNLPTYQWVFASLICLIGTRMALWTAKYDVQLLFLLYLCLLMWFGSMFAVGSAFFV